jgi:dTMP kinase
MNNKHKLIVIDGLDGCGKSTQFELISGMLEKKSIPFKSISFPEYDKTSSALVKMYLNGEISKSPDGVNAFAASSFYAADRYISYKLYWEKNYLQGDVILASRYVSSNAIHQMSKLPEEKWDDYLCWLEDYEYNRMELPRPDKVLFLDMPLAISSKLISSRYSGDESKRDIHEADTAYLEKCRKTALYAAKKCGWEIIGCSSGDAPLPINEINDKICRSISDIIF